MKKVIAICFVCCFLTGSVVFMFMNNKGEKAVSPVAKVSEKEYAKDVRERFERLQKSKKKGQFCRLSISTELKKEGDK